MLKHNLLHTLVPEEWEDSS